MIPGPGGVKLLVAVQGELTCSAKLDVSPCVRVAAERDQHHHFQGPGDWVGAHHRNRSRFSCCQNILLHQN